MLPFPVKSSLTFVSEKRYGEGKALISNGTPQFLVLYLRKITFRQEKEIFI